MVIWLKQLFPNLRDAAIRWTEDDASSLAASVAYYLALSLFPMMLLLTSGLGLFLQFTHLGRNAELKILTTIEMQTSPEVKVQVEQVLEQLRNHSVVTGPFGLGAAILAAIGVFAQIDRGFDKIFRIQQTREESLQRTLFRVLRHRFFAFVMLICVGGAILTLFAGSTMLSQVRSVTGSNLPSLKHVFGLFDFCFEYLSNTLLFALVYRWLPKKKVAWTDALRGGMLASAVWELGRTILSMFLIGMRYTTAYGAIGSFIAILLWCYYGISILFFGAEYVQVLERKRTKANSKLPIEQGPSAQPDSLPRKMDYHEDSVAIRSAETASPIMIESKANDHRSEAGRTLSTGNIYHAKRQPRRTTSSG